MKTLAMAALVAALSATSATAQFNPFCRLSSSAINTSIVAPLPNTPPANSMTAAAVYELKPIKPR